MLQCTLIPAREQRPVTLQVSGAATITNIQQFKTTLADALTNHPDLVVDCEGVTDADFSCLQLLCSAHRTSQTMSLSGTTTRVMEEIIHAAGLARITGCCQARDKQSCIWVSPA